MNSFPQRLRDNPPALTTSLCGVLGIHCNNLRTSIFRFVRKQLPEHPKSCISSRQGEVVVFEHKVEGEVFDCNETIRLGQCVRGLVPEVQALVLDTLVDLCNQIRGFASSVTALLSSGKAALGFFETVEFGA